MRLSAGAAAMHLRRSRSGTPNLAGQSSRSRTRLPPIRVHAAPDSASSGSIMQVRGRYLVVGWTAVFLAAAGVIVVRDLGLCRQSAGPHAGRQHQRHERPARRLGRRSPSWRIAMCSAAKLRRADFASPRISEMIRIPTPRALNGKARRPHRRSSKRSSALGAARSSRGASRSRWWSTAGGPARAQALRPKPDRCRRAAAPSTTAAASSWPRARSCTGSGLPSTNCATPRAVRDRLSCHARLSRPNASKAAFQIRRTLTSTGHSRPTGTAAVRAPRRSSRRLLQSCLSDAVTRRAHPRSSRREWRERRRGDGEAARHLLAGHPGLERFTWMRKGNRIEAPGIRIQRARAGHDVYLTIDHDLQGIAEGALRRAVEDDCRPMAVTW